MFDRIKRIVDVKKSEEEFAETMKNIELEKTDTPAMMIAAFLVLTPALLLVMGFFYGLIWLLFLR